MDTERAKAIARMLLDKLHPPLTLEQIYQIAPTHAQKLIKQGKIEEATSVMKQVTGKIIIS